MSFLRFLGPEFLKYDLLLLLLFKMFQQDIYTSVKLKTAINVCPA